MFYQAILPELVAKYFSRKAKGNETGEGGGSDSTNGTTDIQGKDIGVEVWCICKDKEYGRIMMTVQTVLLYGSTIAVLVLSGNQLDHGTAQCVARATDRFMLVIISCVYDAYADN